ncbi:MAG: hypothetical protein HY319_16640 [Armatimonadetes bacterium]|nr:hypothetical protein [Armatimonadota bacterium]
MEELARAPLSARPALEQLVEDEDLFLEVVEIEGPGCIGAGRCIHCGIPGRSFHRVCSACAQKRREKARPSPPPPEGGPGVFAVAMQSVPGYAKLILERYEDVGLCVLCELQSHPKTPTGRWTSVRELAVGPLSIAARVLELCAGRSYPVESKRMVAPGMRGTRRCKRCGEPTGGYCFAGAYCGDCWDG